MIKSKQLTLPTIHSSTLPHSGRTLTTISSDDGIVYVFWFTNGVITNASLKVYGVDSIDVQLIGCKHKAGGNESS